jgi:hypothetical protein
MDGESIKVGDIIKYNEKWGVIYMIENSYAYFRIQDYISPEPSQFQTTTKHDWELINLIEYHDTFLHSMRCLMILIMMSFMVGILLFFDSVMVLSCILSITHI